MANMIGESGRAGTLVRFTPERARSVRRAITRARQWACGLALAFAAVAVLVAAGATEPVDEWASELAQSVAWYPLDVAASVFSALGQMEVTALVALILTLVWWRRSSARGLVPLLLFAGVAVEAALKHLVPHPAPPAELSRSISLLPFLHSSSPYSFPSGHVFRVTFLAALMTSQSVFWTLAVLMALTRVYLNEHWASDVVGGFLLGVSLAGFAAWIYADRQA